MKKRIFALGCMAALLSFSNEAQATVPAPTFSYTSTATATAKIAVAIAIEKTSDLAFGTIVPSNTAGTVTIDPAGKRTGSSSVQLLSTTSTSAAKFNVTGENHATYAVTLPSDETITIRNGDKYMKINKFTASALTGDLEDGKDTFTVGGTLEVGANQTSGNYTGTFNVLAAYN